MEEQIIEENILCSTCNVELALHICPEALAHLADPVSILNRDLRVAASTLTAGQARFLVDLYYQWQEDRKSAKAQIRASLEEPEPHGVIAWLSDNTTKVEDYIKIALAMYSNAHTLGQWAQSILGIGPVISAGLMAHIDITKAPTVGHIWSFAGVNPEQRKWEKGTKRPFNAKLKVLVWKIGESFVKVSNNPRDIYGHVYAERKLLEQERNEAGLFADQAANILTVKNIGKTTDAYKAYSVGKLPPAHIHARAKRYAAKLFLAHYHHVAYEIEYNEPPPKPYVIDQLGHSHYLAPPNWPMD